MNSNSIILPIIASIFIISCSTCKIEENIKEKITKSPTSSYDNIIFEGRITNVGNEPFTQLGIILDDTTVYLLECDNDTKTALQKDQGQLYRIFAKEKVETEFGMKLLVYNTEIIKQ
jgi:hypothetical protein